MSKTSKGASRQLTVTAVLVSDNTREPGNRKLLIVRTSSLPHSPNFAFLATHDENLVRLATLAERYFDDDEPVSVLLDRIRAERAKAAPKGRTRRTKRESAAA
jgi:hypothetical protein